MSLRTIRHPGPVAAERYQAVACRVEPLLLTLDAGIALNAAVARAFAAAGYRAGWAELAGVVMREINYVIPAGSPGADHAAWYSETFRLTQGGIIRLAGLHLGQRDGEPFLHCHGVWEVPEEGSRMGHLLPFEAVLAEPAGIKAYGIAGAVLVARDDAETNFRLFAPRQSVETDVEGSHRALLATVRPNEDICQAIETICARFDVAEASVVGIGSLVGVCYEDGRDIPDYATEVLIRNGAVQSENGVPRCRLDIDMIGMSGVVSSGRLAHGRNPVCVTFELLIISH